MHRGSGTCALYSLKPAYSPCDRRFSLAMRVGDYQIADRQTDQLVTGHNKTSQICSAAFRLAPRSSYHDTHARVTPSPLIAG